MKVFEHRPTLRWLVPLSAALLLGTGGSAVGIITAAARGGLPQRTAAQLLVDVQNARLDGLSGTVVQDADLGLPSLPGIGGSGSSDMTSLVSGSHTLRLWYADPDHMRLALLGSLGESDLVRNGKDLWSWSSKDKSATHRTVPLVGEDAPRSLASASPMTPQQAADAALRAITPSTRVTTDGTAVVAGRPAYELVLRPRDAGSLVGSVRIAIDGRTHVPTRVQVFAVHGGKPAFEVGFSSFEPADPPASVFRFNPPPATKVTESGAAGAPPTGSRPDVATGEGTAPRVVGKGWTAVAVARVPADALGASRTTSRMLETLPRVSGDWGSGHLLRGTLFSAVLTADGRVAIGPVAPDTLYAALAAP
jgi:outer membrane lipoprotein-sorting protein